MMHRNRFARRSLLILQTILEFYDQMHLKQRTEMNGETITYTIIHMVIQIRLFDFTHTLVRIIIYYNNFKMDIIQWCTPILSTKRTYSQMIKRLLIKNLLFSQVLAQKISYRLYLKDSLVTSIENHHFRPRLLLQTSRRIPNLQFSFAKVQSIKSESRP